MLLHVLQVLKEAGSLAPTTHIYSAWEGFPLAAKQAVGALFVATPSVRCIAIVQRSLRNQVGRGRYGHRAPC